MSSLEQLFFIDFAARRLQNPVMNLGMESYNIIMIIFLALRLPKAILFDRTKITKFLITWEDLTIEWNDRLNIKYIHIYC